MKLPFLSEVIAESMCRAMGCVSIREVPNGGRPRKPLEMEKRSIQPHEVETHVALA